MFSLLQTKLGSRPDSAQRQYCRYGTTPRWTLLILSNQYWIRSCLNRREDPLNLTVVTATLSRALLVHVLRLNLLVWKPPHQKWVSSIGASHVFYHKDWLTHGISLLNDMIVFSVYKLNMFNILCFIHKCKYNLKLVGCFAMFLRREQETNMRSEMKILFMSLYVKKIIFSIAFHIVDPTFRTEQ